MSELAATDGALDSVEPSPLSVVVNGEASFTFAGERFDYAETTEYEYELLAFADVATAGTDAGSLAGAAATLRLLRAAVRDWPRFDLLARTHRAQVRRDLMPVVVGAATQSTDRPTGPPSGSSAGRPTIPQSSEVDSYSRVIERETAAGRPDRAVIVGMARSQRSD